MNSRLLVAMAAYAVLALLTALTLTGTFRIVVWVVLALFAVKTWIASKIQNTD
jgi:hypothetical protein